MATHDHEVGGYPASGRGGKRIAARISRYYEEDLRALNNLAEQYLIFAEGQAMRRIAMTMQDWVSKLEGFLTLNDREILQGAGKVSAELAKAHAEQEFGKFRVLDDQHFESDFDQMLKRLPTPTPGKKN
ncbi:MAG: virulence RhuM family protein [Nitrosomonadales bacterium]|nr:virulence RhuM family protein [Nitrosomonadales bacterium]